MKKIALILSVNHSENKAVQMALGELDAEIQSFAIADIDKLEPKAFDALVLPGQPEAEESKALILIQKFHEDSSPVGAVGVAPFLVAKALGEFGVAVTAADFIDQYGAEYIECEADDFITDRQNKVVTTTGKNYTGVQKAMAELFEMA